MTNYEEIDRALADLNSHKHRWARTAISDKLRYLDGIRRHTGDAADEWVQASLEGKRLPPDSPLAGEEWISGPYALLTCVNAYEMTLRALQAGADPLHGVKVSTRPDGQVVARVFPHTLYDRLLLNGYKMDVWMEPGVVTPENLRDNVAGFYRQADPRGKVGLILGAGNISSIAPMDVLTRMFANGQVVVVKLNPISEYLGPIFERIFNDLITEGFVRMVYGGSELGSYLTTHRLVETIHMTGASRTHDTIVYGPGEAGADRKARDERVNTKPITSELGGVGPTIVVPGPWSEADMAYQAEHLATQKFHNAGFNCIASQVLVLPAEWRGSDRLVNALRETVKAIPAREAYYPGADQRQAAAVAKYPHAEFLDDGAVPRTLITDVDPESRDEYCFTTEFFGGVYATTKLVGKDPAEFLANAVDFANERLHGTLGAQLIIHPKTIRKLGPALDEAIARLRYGTVGVNSWTGAGYLLPTAAWGAYPGHTHPEVGSGMGFVHNAFMFDRPQKNVVYAPFFPFPRALARGEFHLSPKPPWFVTHRRAHTAGERLTRFAAQPSLRHIPGMLAAAIRH